MSGVPFFGLCKNDNRMLGSLYWGSPALQDYNIRGLLALNPKHQSLGTAMV